MAGAGVGYYRRSHGRPSAPPHPGPRGQRALTANWLVFDYGGVISRHTEALPDLAARMGVALDRFEPAYWAVRDGYDRGCTDLEYWRALGSAVGVEVDEETSAALTEIDINGWLHTDEDTVRLLGELAAAGGRLALLSNAPASFGRVAERQPWTEHFEHLVFSGDLRIAKPDPEIWTALAGTVGASTPECLFVDDRQVNIDGARAAGMHAHLWSSAAELRPELLSFATL
jgi:putative hydrolase of the HAD superfamily